ncbi:MAG: hypothetical protein ACFFAY_14510 [Promethearchaeota archaeon]
MTTTLKAIIDKLVSNSKIKHYYDSRVFMERIRDEQDAAEILVRIMDEGTKESSIRAGRMLSMCTISAILPLVKELTTKNTKDKLSRLSLSRLIVLQSGSGQSKRTKKEVFTEVIHHLLPLLNEKSKLEVTNHEEDIEMEYLQYRVCDEAFLVLIYLSEMHFDDGYFQDQDYEMRNSIIKTCKNRFLVA